MRPGFSSPAGPDGRAGGQRGGVLHGQPAQSSAAAARRTARRSLFPLPCPALPGRQTAKARARRPSPASQPGLTLLLEGDLGPRLPAGPHIDLQDLLLLPLRPAGIQPLVAAPAGGRGARRSMLSAPAGSRRAGTLVTRAAPRRAALCTGAWENERRRRLWCSPDLHAPRSALVQLLQRALQLHLVGGVLLGAPLPCAAVPVHACSGAGTGGREHGQQLQAGAEVRAGMAVVLRVPQHCVAASAGAAGYLRSRCCRQRACLPCRPCRRCPCLASRQRASRRPSRRPCRRQRGLRSRRSRGRQSCCCGSCRHCCPGS